MYTTLLSQQEFTARKLHMDDGYGLIVSAYCSFIDGYGRMNPSVSHLPQECMEQIKEAWRIERGAVIIPGQKYVRRCVKCEDGFYMWKTKKAYFDIIKSLDLWMQE